jgi:hypothetical protein
MTERAKSLALLGALVCLPLCVRATDVPVGVSPGSPERFLETPGRCPTFSWTRVDGASGYDLVVYRLGRVARAARPDETELARESPLLAVHLPAAVSWTPPLGQCLGRDGDYAWRVAASAAADVGKKWSDALLFSVREATSPLAVAEALRRLSKSGSEEVAVRRARGGATAPDRSGLELNDSRPLSARDTRAPAPSRVWAIRSESDSDTLQSFALWGVALNNETGTAGVLGQTTSGTGLVDGVRGETASYDGVGVHGRSTRTDGHATGVEGYTAAAHGYGGLFAHGSSGGTALYARAADDSSADLVLGSTSPATNDGVLRSDPGDSSSDLRIESNDFLVLRLDRDQTSAASFFALRDGANGNILYATEGGAATLNGSLTITSSLTLDGVPGGNLLSEADVQAIADALVAAHEVGHP